MTWHPVCLVYALNKYLTILTLFPNFGIRLSVNKLIRQDENAIWPKNIFFVLYAVVSFYGACFGFRN